jgi:hypothetical protein
VFVKLTNEGAHFGTLVLASVFDHSDIFFSLKKFTVYLCFIALSQKYQP